MTPVSQLVIHRCTDARNQHMYALYLPQTIVREGVMIGILYLSTPIEGPDARHACEHTFQRWLWQHGDYRTFTIGLLHDQRTHEQVWIGFTVYMCTTVFAPGQRMVFWVNQGSRDARVLAVRGAKMLIEYEMPDGTTALRMLSSQGYGDSTSISYYRVTGPWLQHMQAAGIEWLGRPQQTRPPGTVRERFRQLMQQEA
jgi:hypothetical protein